MYSIPANSKKSMLIFGLFTKVDLIIFAVGMVVSLLCLAVLPIQETLWAIVALAPGLICGFLVLPIPNYHNMRTIIKEAYIFYTIRQNFVWKGWCFSNGEDKK